MKNKTVIFTVLLIASTPTVAFAGSEVLKITCDFALLFWGWMQTLVYIIGTIALAIMSMQASILGQFRSGQLVSWGLGLFVMAMTPPIIAFLTSGGISLDCNI
jgi:hypothetical protein